MTIFQVFIANFVNNNIHFVLILVLALFPTIISPSPSPFLLPSSSSSLSPLSSSKTLLLPNNAADGEDNNNNNNENFKVRQEEEKANSFSNNNDVDYGTTDKDTDDNDYNDYNDVDSEGDVRGGFMNSNNNYTEEEFDDNNNDDNSSSSEILMTIYSPFFNRHSYPKNISRSWTLMPPTPNDCLKITFTEFDMEESPECSKDFIEIYDGMLPSAPNNTDHQLTLLVRACGRQLQPQIIMTRTTPSPSSSTAAIGTGLIDGALVSNNISNRSTTTTTKFSSFLSTRGPLYVVFRTDNNDNDNNDNNNLRNYHRGFQAHVSQAKCPTTLVAHREHPITTTPSFFNLAEISSFLKKHPLFNQNDDNNELSPMNSYGKNVDDEGGIALIANTMSKSRINQIATSLMLIQPPIPSNNLASQTSSSSSSSSCGRPAITPELLQFRIVGGSVARAHSWPWQASLRYQQQHVCGGSLIAPNYVLTAAHCFARLSTNPLDFRVLLGKHNKFVDDEGQQEFDVEEIVIHENYPSSSSSSSSSATSHHVFNINSQHDSDIALVRLSPITPSASTSSLHDNNKNRAAAATLTRTVSTVCLPPPAATTTTKEDELVPTPGTTCYVTGFGETNGTGGEQFLKQTSVDIVGAQMCVKRDKRLKRLLTKNMLCAYRELSDSCQGDSGGPLVCERNGQWWLDGIVSFGIGCAGLNSPGVYVRTANFVPWITKKAMMP